MTAATIAASGNVVLGLGLPPLGRRGRTPGVIEESLQRPTTAWTASGAVYLQCGGDGLVIEGQGGRPQLGRPPVPVASLTCVAE